MSHDRDRRFWEKVRKGECWEWTGCITNRGYGLFQDGKKLRSVHRWSYERFIGQIPDGLTIDHLCRNRACVRPDHLEPVSARENVLRGIGISAENARKTECLRGHPLSGDNLYLYQGKRHCRACRAANDKARRAARKTMPHSRDRTHCPRGHPYAGDNLRIHHGRRVCRECRRTKQREARRRARIAP